MKSALNAIDVFTYAHEDAKIMIQNGWFEEPLQMEEQCSSINKTRQPEKPPGGFP
ncbi:hypothetical protein [Peribacillus deserti]|uniref:hypothetical protein n=1 Tax=Peribacillus deserti TaxID=673318 RepID=UPI0015E102F5|nr:hypothetical protein [Peribacillus deserti]